MKSARPGYLLAFAFPAIAALGHAFQQPWSVGRPAHHHLDPFCSYTTLNVIEDSPLPPYGYATALVLSLVPPLWFKVMNPRVADVFARRDQLQAQGFI